MRQSRVALERFAAHFTELDSGSMLYKPPGAASGLVVGYAEYATVLERLQARLRLAVVLNWLVVGGSGLWGVRAYLRSGSLLDALIPFAIGLAIAFLLSLRTHLDVLRPLEAERRALEDGQAISRTRH